MSEPDWAWATGLTDDGQSLTFFGNTQRAGKTASLTEVSFRHALAEGAKRELAQWRWLRCEGRFAWLRRSLYRQVLP